MTAAVQRVSCGHNGQPRLFEYLSFSSLSLYQQCPLRFTFRYVLGLPEETVGASLVFGSAVHAALEFHFRELLVGRALDRQHWGRLAIVHINQDSELTVQEESGEARRSS